MPRASHGHAHAILNWDMTTTSKSSPQSSVLPLHPLGNSDLHITPIGLGAWAIGGGDWQFSWGAQEDRDSVAAIERALDLGINWIDTAAIYGLGHSEEVVAQALKNASRKPYVFTKCSMLWKKDGSIHRSLKSATLRAELGDSLRRLKLDVIDLYQIHWPDPDAEIEEGWETLAKLQQEGKVRHIGVSNFNVAQMKRAQRIAPITSLQPPFSIVNPAVADEILPFCKQNNIGVIVYSPMASGLLTGTMSAERIRNLPQDDWRRRSPQFNEPNLSRNLELAEFLRKVGHKHGVEPGVIAIAWTLHNPAVTGAIVGGRNPGQVEGTFPAASVRLTDEELASIESFRKR
jgi:aryl-alcohol dehydrogenase-like predicted oxidoreductase